MVYDECHVQYANETEEYLPAGHKVSRYERHCAVRLKGDGWVGWTAVAVEAEGMVVVGAPSLSLQTN